MVTVSGPSRPRQPVNRKIISRIVIYFIVGLGGLNIGMFIRW